MMLALLLDSAVRALALAIVVWVVLSVTARSSAGVQMTAWRLVLAAAIAMPLLSLPARSLAPELPIASTIPLGMDVVAAIHAPSWSSILSIAYLAVAALLLIRQLAGWLRGYRLLRRSVRCTADWAAGHDVRLSADLVSPATFASAILLPKEATDWTASTRAAVMAHESTHVRNRDFLLLAAAGIHRAVFWFSPLSWWLPRRLALLAEHASDDAAVAATGDHVAYAALLLEFAQRTPRAHGALAMAQASIGRRIERILGGSAAGRAPKNLPWKAGATLAGLLLATTAVALVQFEGRSAPTSDPLLPLTHPEYPTAARRLGERGTVVLDLYVQSDGSVGDVRVHKSSGFVRLDDSAAREARRWRLAPGTLNGDSVAAWGRFAVTFKLD